MYPEKALLGCDARHKAFAIENFSSQTGTRRPRARQKTSPRIRPQAWSPSSPQEVANENSMS